MRGREPGSLSENASRPGHSPKGQRRLCADLARSAKARARLLHSVRYDDIPRRRTRGGAGARAALPVGQLDLDRSARGRQGPAGTAFGSVLLADALQRSFESADTVGSSMVIVDALDETAAGFYAAHGFVRLPDAMRLVLPMRLADGRTER